jgi:PAS domain S-box-containing protein
MAKSMPTTQSDELERLRLRVAELEGAQQLQRGTDKQLQLEAMVSNASIILFSLDREGVFTLSEGSGLSLLGLEPGQAVGESVFEFFGDHKQIVSECRRAIAGESFHSIVELGDLVFATHYNPILDTDGTIKGTIGVSINITDTHRAQRARDESEAKYRSLVDTAPAIIMTVNRDGEILFINRTVEGYDVKDVIGTNIDDYVSEDQRHAQDDALK